MFCRSLSYTEPVLDSSDVVPFGAIFLAEFAMQVITDIPFGASDAKLSSDRLHLCGDIAVLFLWLSQPDAGW